jgi:predicted transcriptional regulator
LSAIEETGKEEILSSAKYQFRKAGYSISDDKLNSSSFDFIAKKQKYPLLSDPVKLIIRVLADLDYFKKSTSIDLQLISKLVQGNPLLIAHSATGKKIEEATLYRRYNVPAISLRTLQLFLQRELSKKPFKLAKFAYRGGIHVNISLSRFTRQKEQSSINLTELADKIGVSRQSLYNYEKGISSPKIDTFQKIKKIMGPNLKESIDIFRDQDKFLAEKEIRNISNPRSPLQKEITRYLEDKDFHIIWFRAEPFDGMSIDEQKSINDSESLQSLKSIFTGVTTTNIEKDKARMLLLKKLSLFLEKRTIWFEEEENVNKSQKQKQPSFFTTLGISELERMGSEEFLDFLDQTAKSHLRRQSHKPLKTKSTTSKGN